MVPEERGGRQELDGKEEPFLVQLRGTETLTSTFCWVLGFSMMNLVALGQASEE